MDPAAGQSHSPRLLMPSSHADLRATWHGDRGVVLSLWHGDVCTASAPLPVSEAARLAGFLVDHVAAWAAAAHDDGRSPAQPDGGADRAGDSRSPTAQHPSARPTPIGLAGARDGGDRRHLRAAPEPGAGQRTGAAVDEVVAAGGTAMRAAVTAARQAWRARRG